MSKLKMLLLIDYLYFAGVSLSWTTIYTSAHHTIVVFRKKNIFEICWFTVN